MKGKLEPVIRNYVVEISCPGGVYSVPVTLGLKGDRVVMEFDHTDIPVSDRQWLESSDGGSHAADLVMRHHQRVEMEGWAKLTGGGA